jgi:uncharacterized membrane protein YqiK
MKFVEQNLGMLIVIGLVLLGLIVILSIIAKLYRKATKELAFVRTGIGGEKVIVNGGAIVIALFHEVIDVNLRTLRLVVTRREKQALITKDKIRVDVEVEFYLRVKQDQGAISIAAQTLGSRTKDVVALKELIEGKFVDALRSVSAEMEMNELHEKRSDFVQKVQNALASDLEKNGLELESVSLTGLDQTNIIHFDSNNAFDAQGLTKITKTIEENKKIQNDLKQATSVEIAQKNLDTEKQHLVIREQETMAKLAQQEEIANKAAEQSARVSQTQTEQKKLAEEAEIKAKRQIEEINIAKDKSIQEAEIEKSISISEKTKNKEIAQGLLKETEILTARKVEEAQIEKNRAVKEAEIASEIVLAQKSQEHSKAETLKNQEYAKAVISEEQITTAKETEKADRAKKVSLIKANEKAEMEAIEIIVAAKAKADSAKLEAAAIMQLAEAEKKKYEIEAEGKRKINEAVNIVSDAQIALTVKLAIIKAMPSIIEAAVKPIESIDSLKVVDIKGLDGFGSSNTNGGKLGVGNSTQDLVNAALRYKAESPLLDSLLEEIGIKGKNIEDFTGFLAQDINTQLNKSEEETPLAEEV